MRGGKSGRGRIGGTGMDFQIFIVIFCLILFVFLNSCYCCRSYLFFFLILDIFQRYSGDSHRRESASILIDSFLFFFFFCAVSAYLAMGWDPWKFNVIGFNWETIWYIGLIDCNVLVKGLVNIEHFGYFVVSGGFFAFFQLTSICLCVSVCKWLYLDMCKDVFLCVGLLLRVLHVELIPREKYPSM